MYVDIVKSCSASEEKSVLSENTNSNIDDISFVPYDRIKSKKGLAFTSPFFLARRKGFEPLTFWFVAKHSIQLS